MIIGLLSDTHLPNVIHNLGELGSEPGEFFAGVDLILHSGDLTTPRVLDWLEQFAPVICSTGNNDPIPDDRSDDVQTLEIEGWRIGMVHSLEGQFRPIKDLQTFFPQPVEIMIAGHTHQERLEHRDGVTLINSGSITFPHHKELRMGSVGLLELKPRWLKVEILPLGDTPGSPNPCQALSIEVEKNDSGPCLVTQTP